MNTRIFDIKKSDHLSVDHFNFARVSRVFNDWNQSLDTPIASCTIDAVDFRGKPSVDTVMFVRLKVRTEDKPFDQIVQLRGNTVGLLVVIACEGQKYTLLTEQVRLPMGGLLKELPAGMIDDGTFGGAAAKEIQEETGLTIREEDLILLSTSPVYLSPGLLDEAMQFYAAEKTMSRDDLNTFMGKTTGLAEEHEHITLHVVELDQLTRVAHEDAKAHIAYQLYQEHVQNIGTEKH